jgi:hypothetical protein
MAFGSVTLEPGVNVERTPMVLRAGYSSSSLIRFLNGLAQKLGGWLLFYPFSLPGTPRDLHAWEDLNQAKHLAIGTTTTLQVLTSGTLVDITPQTFASSFAPNFSTTAGSPIVQVVDPNIANVTVLDSIFFEVPVSQGGLVLDGLYQIEQINSTDSYQFNAGTNATTTETNPTVTSASTASGNNTLHFAATPAWIQVGMVIADLTTPAAIPASTTVTATGVATVTMSKNAAGAGVGNGDSIVFSSVPVFTTVNGSSSVNVKFISHGITSLPAAVVFPLATTANGVTLQGAYGVNAIVDANDFTITASNQATAASSFAMNGGDADLVYYLAFGPPPVGSGYGLGGYGSGGYGTGAGSSGVQTGTKITATDWTSDNWGEILIENPKDGPIYIWDPTSGMTNASVISTGPPIARGCFISTSQQILLAYGIGVHQNIGYEQQLLTIGWSNVGDFTNWVPSATDQAGEFPLPNGSTIVAGLSAFNQDLFWTDLDLWAANYIGPPDVFGFNKIGAGMGAVSSHAVQVMRNGVFWMSANNFCSYTGSGASVVPCPVWDAVFQNINPDFLQNVRAMPTTSFNEAGWLYPSAASTSGECDSYVKMNITENGTPWYNGPMSRSAWIDQSVLGMPIGATPGGVLYQHEVSPDAAGNPLVASFTTGFFYLAESEDFVSVDMVIPDFKWTTFGASGSAQIQISFNVANSPNDTPTVYGPYVVTSTTEYITVRFRGRVMSITVTSSDIGSFWRLGSIKYRYTPAGRR